MRYLLNISMSHQPVSTTKNNNQPTNEQKIKKSTAKEEEEEEERQKIIFHYFVCIQKRKWQHFKCFIFYTHLTNEEISESGKKKSLISFEHVLT